MRPNRIGLSVLALAGTGLLSLFGCDRPQPDEPRPVVVYVSADEGIARPILEAFTRETGLEVLAVHDTEATKTTGLASRIRAERDRPRGDLFWSSECFRTIELARAGLLAPMTGPIFDDWMADRGGQWRDETGTWFAFAPRARVLVHRSGYGDEEPLPERWSDLTDPRWRGRLAMADPRFGTTSGHLGALSAVWNADTPGRYEAWVDGLLANRPAILASGNAGVVEAVASGAADLGLTDTDDVWAARERGLDVDLVYPRHLDGDGGGTLLVPNTVARIAGGPNPEGAHRLARWLLSEEVERRLAESPSRNLPLRGDPGSYAVPDPLEVDLVGASEAMGPAITLFRERLRSEAAP